MDNSSPKIYTEFLPISRADMEARGWDQLDFVVVGGDAYVDHPSFGPCPAENEHSHRYLYQQDRPGWR